VLITYKNLLFIIVAFSLSVGGLQNPAKSETMEHNKIAVLDLIDKGVGKDVSSLLTSAASNQLSAIGIFTVISREDIKNMLTHGQDKLLLGCSDESCLVNIGGVLGAKHLVAGSVGKVGKKYIISLQRIDVGQAKVMKRVERQFEGNKEKLLQEVKHAAYKVVEDILKTQSGIVKLDISEEGADVSLDGNTVGVSPLKSLQVPAGPRDIRVVKAGFIDWVKTIQVSPKNVMTVDVTMIPSATYIQSYQDEAKSMRMWAWITLGTFVAMEATAISLKTYTYINYDPIENDYLSGNYRGMTAAEFYDKYKDDMDRAEIMDYAALGLGIAGVAAGVISLYLFLEGDDPAKYKDFDNLKKGDSGQASSFIPVITPKSVAFRWNF